MPAERDVGRVPRQLAAATAPPFILDALCFVASIRILFRQPLDVLGELLMPEQSFDGMIDFVEFLVSEERVDALVAIQTDR